MLGLGLALSVAKGVIDEIGGLLSKLARRSTYSENLADSRAVVSDIDSYDLLDKATILLTPTATSNARVHSVKTYTGDELLTNGGFDSDSDWTKLNATISGGKGNLDGDGQTALLYQGILTNGKTYKATFTVSDYNNLGEARIIDDNGATKYTITSDGTFTVYFTHNVAASNFLFRAKNGAVYSIDNVSVTEADADFDFDRASSATRINSSGLVQDMQSITDPELVLNGDFEELGDELVTNGDFSNSTTGWTNASSDTFEVVDGGVGHSTSLHIEVSAINRGAYQSVFDADKTYYVSLDLKVVSGSVYIGKNTRKLNNQNYNNSDWQTITGYLTAIDDKIRIYGDEASEYYVDNVSVQQVDPNDRWSLTSQGDSTSIITDKLTLTCDDGDNVSAAQSYSFTDGNTYKLSFDLTGDNQNKNITIRDNSGATGGLSENVSLNFTGTETKTFIFTANSNSNSIYTKRVSSGTYSWSIDNVSLKDITFSTDVDLARINYDSNGDNGHILLEPTSTNLVPYSEDFSQSFWNSSTYGQLSSDNLVSAPDNSISAQKWKRTSGTYNILRPTTNITGTDKSMSIFVKNISADNFYLRGSSSFYFYNFSSQTVSNSNLKAEQYPNGWIRLSTSDTNDNFKQFGIGESETDSTELNNEVYIWGAQIEALPYVTSYIPTLTGSTVTRATETLTGSGNSTLINSTEGVLYAEIEALVNGGDDRIISLSDETNDNLIYIRIDNTANRINSFARGGGGTYNTLTVNGVSQTNNNKIALVWDASNVRVWINGSQSLTQSINNSPVGMKTLTFTSPTGGNPFYGKCKALAVFNEALSGDELELLTGITNYGSFGELASANGYTII